MRVKPQKSVHPSTAELDIRTTKFLNCHYCDKAICLAESTYVLARDETNYHLCEPCTEGIKEYKHSKNSQNEVR